MQFMHPALARSAQLVGGTMNFQFVLAAGRCHSRQYTLGRASSYVVLLRDPFDLSQIPAATWPFPLSCHLKPQGEACNGSTAVPRARILLRQLTIGIVKELCRILRSSTIILPTDDIHLKDWHVQLENEMTLITRCHGKSWHNISNLS